MFINKCKLDFNGDIDGSLLGYHAFSVYYKSLWCFSDHLSGPNKQIVCEIAQKMVFNLTLFCW